MRWRVRDLAFAARRARGRSWLRLLGTVVAVVTFGAGAAELFLRWFPEHLPAEARFRLHRDALRTDGGKSRPHDYLGYLWRPYQRDSVEGIDFHFTYTTDEHGFRNAGPWPERADVVVLGDSQAFGFGVEDHQVWVRLVDDKLPGQEVLNLGLIGAAPQQFLRIYEHYGAALRPDVVLVAFFPPNAVYAGRLFDDWVTEGRPDRFDARRSGERHGDTDGLWSVIRSYARHSYLARALYSFVETLLGDPSPREIAFADGGRVQLLPRLSSAPEPADFEIVIDALLRLQEAVERSGAEMLVVPFPTKEEVHRPLLGADQGESWGILVEPFLAAFERLGIRYVDPTPVLQERALREERLFFEVDIHPNAQGYRLIAEIIALRLQKLTGLAGPDD